jgi:hypothetical protein
MFDPCIDLAGRGLFCPPQTTQAGASYFNNPYFSSYYPVTPPDSRSASPMSYEDKISEHFMVSLVFRHVFFFYHGVSICARPVFAAIVSNFDYSMGICTCINYNP